MFTELLGVVALLCGCSQALPSFPRQVVFPRAVPLITPIVAVPELESARLEFMEELDGAVSSVITEITGQYLEDTEEVKQVKQEFMKVFNNALNGFINSNYLDDTAEVAASKEEFFKVFEAATNGMLKTIENFYIEDTPEVADAKELFYRAFEDAKAGRVGAQYIPYTPAVQKARDEFLRFFQLVVDGMLYKLAPQPVRPYYIPDTPAVNSAKTQFLELYKQALSGDIKAALTVVALEDAISNNVNNPAQAAKAFVQTATELQDMIRILEEGGEENKSSLVEVLEDLEDEPSEESTDETNDETSTESNDNEASADDLPELDAELLATLNDVVGDIVDELQTESE